ncbi:MAG: CheR family methyltransferase [Rhizomicrobium sp.]
MSTSSFAPAQFYHLADLVRRRSGLRLTDDHGERIASKLQPVAARFGFRELGALLDELEDEPEELSRAVVEAMATHETSFFRDPPVFEFLRNTVLPQLMAARLVPRRLRIWCAAASTGQEAYSLAMLLDDAGLFAEGWKVDLFVSDFSRDAVMRITEGAYSEYELVRGLPSSLRWRYCVPSESGRWHMVDGLRRRLRVHCFNLLDSLGWLGDLDLILCRNALLYFAPDIRLETLARLSGVLASDGWLILGTSETPVDARLYLPVAGAPRGIFSKNPALMRRAG